MKYNRYVAFGVARGGIRVTTPFVSIQRATQAYFEEYPHEKVCSVRRVAVMFDGSNANDPSFVPKRITKINA